MNYYKRHLGDYARKAGHLTMLEHGAYNLILDAYYDREQAPTRQEAMRYARARSDEEVRAVEVVLEEFFTERDGRYYQARVEEEFASAAEIAARNKANGSKGGRPRKGTKVEPNQEPKKTQSVSGGLPDGKREETQTKGNPLIHQSTNPEAKTKAAAVPPEDFRADLFRRWKELPNGGGGAFLNKLFRDHKPEQRVLEAVEHTLDETRNDPKAYVVAALSARARAESAHDDLMARAI